MTEDTRQSPKLRPILVSRIAVNPENPRGHDPVADKSFWYLVQSIKDFGVLVPLLVRPTNEDSYQLIDGERRLLAAKQIALKTVPAYVMREPLDPEAIRNTMFHIHHNRESWKAYMECNALDPLYRKLVDEHGSEDSATLVRELVRRTGMNSTTARNRLQFLRWPAEIKDAVYEGRAPYWFIVELEDKIVQPAQTTYPEYFVRVPPAEVRRLLFRKWEEGVVGAAENVRPAAVIARYKVPPADREEAQDVFERLVQDETWGFSAARDEFVWRFPDAEEPPPKSPRALYNELLRLVETLGSYNEEYVIEGVGRSKVEPGAFLAALEQLVRAASQFMDRISETLE